MEQNKDSFTKQTRDSFTKQTRDSLTKQTREDELLLLREWLAIQAPDRTFTWTQIERETGCQMDKGGKLRFYHAAGYEGIEYTTLKGDGVLLAGPVNGAAIVGERIQKVCRTTRRAEKAAQIISNDYLLEMHPTDQRKMVQMNTMLSTMILASKPQKTRSEPVQMPQRRDYIPSLFSN